MTLQIRPATDLDGPAAVSTLRQSIAELCTADHHNDAAAIAEWQSNKTVEAWRRWVAREDTVLVVALRDSKVAGVGMAALSGDILLNYVHPSARFCGVSKAILAELEHMLRSRGLRRCRLESTRTAQAFYKSRGYRPEGRGSHLLSKSF